MFLLGLVGLAAFEASKPANWIWLTRAGVPDEAPAAGDPAEPDRNADAPKQAEALPPDQVRIVPHEADAPPLMSSPRSAGSPLDAAALATIRDDVMGIRRAESDAYFHLLALARETPPQVLARQARSDVSYAALMNDPERYRGQLLSLKGEVRRFTRLPAGENEAGFDSIYDGWMFTPDAGRKSPYRVICTEKPTGFPEGETIREAASFVGYFFKRVGYETAHGAHSAPMLLGHCWEPTPTSRPLSTTRHAGRYVVWGLAIAITAFAYILWRLSAADRRLKARGSLSREQAPPTTLSQVPPVEADDPGRFLVELARDKPADSAGAMGDQAQ